MIIGHDAVRGSLESRLPSVSLVVGPAHVGKWTLVQHALKHHGIESFDRFESESLTADEIRYAQEFMRSAPYGKYRVMVARIDKTSESSMQALYRLTEEPPSYARFFFVSEKRPSGPLLSRVQVFRCGYLSEDEVSRICQSWGMSQTTAEESARAMRGSLMAAEDATQEWLRAQDQVVQLLKTISTHDKERFDSLCSSATEHTRLLFLRWVNEVVTGHWQVFRPSVSAGIHLRKQDVRRMVLALSEVDEVRPKIALQVALTPFVTGAAT